MKRLVPVVLMTLTGCVSIAGNPIDESSTVKNLSDEIECELQAAFPVPSKADQKTRPHWTVSYEIEEYLDRRGSLSLDPLSWVVPAGVEKLVLGANGSVSQEKERKATVKINRDLFQRVENLDCRKWSKKAGRLQLKRWGDQVYAMDVADPKTGGDTRVQEFGYVVKITNSGDAHLGPTLENDGWTASASTGTANSVSEQVSFAFSRYSPPNPDGMPVFVTNMPRTGKPGLMGGNVGNRGLGEKKLSPFDIPKDNIYDNNDTLQRLRNPDR